MREINLLALVAMFLALIATVMTICLMAVPKFVELYIPGNTSLGEPELSCSVAHLGVYRAGLDVSCLDEELLVKSGLNLEPIEEPTLEFPLLFPGQTEFINDVNPLYSENTTWAFPEFETCGQYYSELKTGQNTLWFGSRGALDPRIFGSFISPVVSGIFVNWFGTPSPLKGSLVQVSTAITKAVIGSAEPTLLTEQVTTDNVAVVAPKLAGYVSAAPSQVFEVDSDARSLFQAISDATTVDQATVTESCLNRMVADCVNYLFQQHSIGLSATQSLVTGEEFPVEVCDAGAKANDASATSGCNVLSPISPGLTTSMGYLSAFISDALESALNQTVFTSQLSSTQITQLELATQGYQAIGLFANFMSGGLYASTQIGLSAVNPSYANIETLIDVDSTPALILVSTDVTLPYPSAFNDQFQACQLPLFFANIGEQPFPNAVVSTLEQCPFEIFMSNIVQIAVENTDQNADDFNPAEFEQSLSLLSLVQKMFLGCEESGVEDPNTCWNGYFAAYILKATFSYNLDLENFASNPNSPWLEATAKCLDDDLDAEAIQFAQRAVPVSLVLFFFATVVGHLGVQGNKYASLSSSILAFIGALLILIALLKLYQAPIYDNVGAPIEVYKPHYKGGVGRWLGLISIGTGLISAILFLLAVCLCQPSEKNGSYRDIKVKESPGEEQQGETAVSAA